MNTIDIKLLYKEALRIHKINCALDPNLPEENYLLLLNIKKLERIENQLETEIQKEEGPNLRLVVSN